MIIYYDLEYIYTSKHGLIILSDLTSKEQTNTDVPINPVEIFSVSSLMSLAPQKVSALTYFMSEVLHYQRQKK